ncbi:MAG: transposase, partial [Actinoallomurus sp.]
MPLSVVAVRKSHEFPRVQWRLDQEGRSSHGEEVPYPAELRRRVVAVVAEVRNGYDTEFAVITAVAHRLGIGSAETVRKWVRQAEVDAGTRSGVSSVEAEEIRQLKRKVAELE